MSEKINNEYEKKVNKPSLSDAPVLNTEGRKKSLSAMVRENGERAKASASERTAIFEYGSEYRRELIARENKRFAEERARLEADEREARAVREAERNAEIEEFKKRERAELERRAEQAQKILEKLNEETLNEQTGSRAAQEAVIEVSEDTEDIKTEKISDTDEAFNKSSAEKTDRIILNINPNKIATEHDRQASGSVIHIPPVYCHPQNEIYNFHSEAKITELERKHYEAPQSACSCEEGVQRTSAEQPYRDWYGEQYRIPNELRYSDYYENSSGLSDREIDEYERFLSDREAMQSDVAPVKPDDFSYLDDYEKALSEKHLTEYDGNTDDVEHADISIGMDRNDPQGEDIGIFAKTELSRRLSDYHKQESILKTKLKKIDSKKKKLSYAENVRLTVEKIGIHKEIVETAIEALRACVYAESKVNISKHKKFLTKEIFAYNSAIKEYETLTGKELRRISPQIADDVIEGKICDPIPNVYYVDDGNQSHESFTHYEPSISKDNSYSDAFFTDSARSKSADAYDYDDTEENENGKIFEKEHSKRISEIRRISERDVLLVALRNEYKLSHYETEYHMLQHSFAVNDRQKVKRMQRLDRKITKIRSNLRRSVKLERDDNRRYYYLLTVDPMKERVSRDARREVLDALKLRLEILLAERAEINERIIALYGGSDKSFRNLKIERKAAGVRRKYTKVMYRRQQRLAAKVQRMKAPSDLKEKLFELLNKKTEKVAVLEEKIYRLKRARPKGKARCELVRDVKNAGRAIKYVDADIKYLMKKLKRHQQRYEDDKSWAITMIVFSVVAVALVVGWYFYGDTVKAYLYDIWTRLKAWLWL